MDLEELYGCYAGLVCPNGVMVMSNQVWNEELVESYDRVAERYANQFFGELDRKPFDQAPLNRYAESLRGRGQVCDIGCGPGHVAKYLQGRGLDVLGLDISPKMIEVARRLNPTVPFEQGDMLALKLADASFAGVVAFYSVIHLARSITTQALKEMSRVLLPGGTALLAFHGGEGELHSEEFLDQPVSIDATLFQPAEMKEFMENAGFIVDEVLAREPYDFEFQSQRVYICATKPFADSPNNNRGSGQARSGE